MKKTLFGLAFIFFVSFLVVAVIGMRPFGVPLISHMDDYFIQNAQTESGVNNVVTAILFDYRGFDTLGEATVLFTAVIGVAVLFRGGAK